MNKKLRIVALIIAVMISITTITVLAKTMRTDWIEQKISKGYSEADAYSLMAVMVLSDENVSAFVEQKYKELGDWDKVAEYYKIDVNEFNSFVQQQMELTQKLEIPDDLYNEMIASGMSHEDCRQLAISAVNAQFDIKTVWEARKNGKTVNDLIQEDTEIKNAQGQAAADLTFGKITEKEYLEKMQSLSSDMSLSDILIFAAKERKHWMEFRKAASGITDQELELAAKAGMTDFFAACKMKDAEKISNLTFSEMVSKVQRGESVDKVINDSLSKEKVEEARKNTVSAEKE